MFDNGEPIAYPTGELVVVASCVEPQVREQLFQLALEQRQPALPDVQRQPALPDVLNKKGRPGRRPKPTRSNA
jgi:hypothetical protein